MGRYTKYKLYQKYETRGSQEAIPCYPNVFSIDGDGTMPLVIVEENSRDCGYTGETQPIYRWYTLPIDTYYYCDACQDAQYKWVNLPIAEDWECDGTTKYYKQKKMVSVDGGSTWTDVTPPQYQRGALYEYSSQSCGYRTRTSSGSPYCTGYDKYVDVYSQYSTDGGNTWQTTATTPTIVERNSRDCGYVPDPQYRTTSGTPYCSGYDKYVDVYSQVSYDEGATWETTATTQTLVERNSPECGYIEPQYRWIDSGTTCIGYNEFVKTVEQVSYDGGSTWQNTGVESDGDLVEILSDNCGYTPPTIYRWALTNETACTSDLKDEYLTLVALEACRFNFINYTGDLYVSLDEGATWIPINSSGISTTGVGRGAEVRFKGNLSTDMNVPPYGSGTFCSSGKFAVVGNVMSLFYGDNFRGQTSFAGRNNACRLMFSGCTSLVNADYLSLPATTLSDSCYKGMFQGCTNLVKAPKVLPATVLASSCYSDMFQGCSSLTQLPTVLPATSLASNCYNGMFAGCSSLTVPPELPATSLADGCYWNMFGGCTSLTVAPQLPATSIAINCYSLMFDGCSSLVAAPYLPATTLASVCYQYMFRNCTSLVTAQKRLPATTLATTCYSGMFSGCTSLTTAPEIVANYIPQNACDNMFYNCSSLSFVKCNASSKWSGTSTSAWLRGVSSNGIFVKNSSMNWERGYSGIPDNWRIKNA